MSSLFQETILLSWPFSKNISEENIVNFHQIWSWLKKLLTWTGSERALAPSLGQLRVKLIISQRSCLENLSLRTSPKKVKTFIRYDLDLKNSYQEQDRKSFHLYHDQNAYICDTTLESFKIISVPLQVKVSNTIFLSCYSEHAQAQVIASSDLA